MARDEQEWVADILTFIADIRADTAGMALADFAAKPAIVRSVLYSIGVIGEAVKNLSSDFKEKRSEIPWRAIAGMRDRVIHEYFRTDILRVWEVVTEDLSPLEAAIRKATDRQSED